MNLFQNHSKDYNLSQSLIKFFQTMQTEDDDYII